MHVLEGYAVLWNGLVPAGLSLPPTPSSRLTESQRGGPSLVRWADITEEGAETSLEVGTPTPLCSAPSTASREVALLSASLGSLLIGVCLGLASGRRLQKFGGRKERSRCLPSTLSLLGFHLSDISCTEQDEEDGKMGLEKAGGE